MITALRTAALATLLLTPALASAPVRLPLGPQDGYWFYLPVQPGQEVRVTVPGGIRQVTPQRVNPDFTVRMAGKVITIALRRGARTGQGGQEGSTLCLTVRALPSGQYRLCPTAEARGVGQTVTLRP